MNNKNARAIKTRFLSRLETDLSPIIKLILTDKTLDLEFRGNCIIIYYRGSKLAEVSDNGLITCNMQYCREEHSKVIPKPQMSHFIENIPFYKYQIDKYLATENKNEEKEVEQIIVKENNYSGIANSTDYYILDTEYAYQNGDIHARPDLLAIEWKSCQESRKNNSNLTLSFIELKYGDGAVNGSAGIKKHIEDYLYFCHHPEIVQSIAEDMAKVFEYKVKLGLIPSFLKRMNWESDSQISIDYNKPEMLFIFANRDPESDKIKNEISECLKKYRDLENDSLKRIYVVEASSSGYGLYKYDADKTQIRYKTLQEFYETL